MIKLNEQQLIKWGNFILLLYPFEQDAYYLYKVYFSPKKDTTGEHVCYGSCAIIRGKTEPELLIEIDRNVGEHEPWRFQERLK